MRIQASSKMTSHHFEAIAAMLSGMADSRNINQTFLKFTPVTKSRNQVKRVREIT